MPINLTEETKKVVAERFSKKSITDAFCGHDYDFAGVKTIKVLSVDTVPIVDYTREGTARFGSLTELGDTYQELTMTQDKGFTFSIDEGNAAEQYNIKQAAKCLARNWDERATPLIDKYRFNKWAFGAGLSDAASAALTKSNIVENIMKGTSAMSNELVPFENRVVFIRESLYIAVKLSTEIAQLDKAGTSAVIRGVVGEIDGMKVVRVPDVYMPTGVNFMIKYKNCTVDPMKLKNMSVHKRPMGIDGDVGECRFLHDSFIKGTQVDGLYINAEASKIAANPTITISGSSATVASATSGATIKYTLDGTDPKTSPTVLTYSAAVTLASGQTIRAYAAKTGLINSGNSKAIN